MGNRKVFMLFIILLLFFNRTTAQDTISQTPDKQKKFQLNMVLGYNSPFGFWGGNFQYRPIKLMQVYAGGGITQWTGGKFSIGLNVFPFKERRLTPFLSGCYTYINGRNVSIQDDNGNNTPVVIVGPNKYVNAYAGLQFNGLKSRGAHIKLLLGYSFLLGSPNFSIIPSTYSSQIDFYSEYSTLLRRPFFIAIEVGTSF